MYKTTQEFEDFWRQYPNVPRTNSKQTTRGSKKKTWAFWQKMKLEDRLAASGLVQYVKADPFIPQAIVWLRWDGWDDVEKADPVAVMAKKQQDAQRDKQREQDRGKIPYLSEQTPEYRQDYARRNPTERWLIEEIETNMTEK